MPHVCGNDCFDTCGDLACVGITPARAGTTKTSNWIATDRWDDPRSCGNDFGSKDIDDENAGSPPLVRERPSGCNERWAICRITPARAGTTIQNSATHIPVWDHPRSCGNDRWMAWKKIPNPVRCKLQKELFTKKIFC
jgi:hypothetical protein